MRELIIGVGAFTAGALVIIFGVEYQREYRCDSYQEVTGFKTKYVSFDGCYVKGSNGVFVRYDNKFKKIK